MIQVDYENNYDLFSFELQCPVWLNNENIKETQQRYFIEMYLLPVNWK